MSIIRVGLAETKNFAEGYEAIFGANKKKPSASKPKASAKTPTAKKKKTPAKKKK